MTKWRPRVRPEVLRIREQRIAELDAAACAFPGVLGLKANLRRMKQDHARMTLDNHFDVKSGDAPRWVKELEDVEKRIEETETLLTGGANGGI